MIKNNSKFGLTVTKAMRLMDKSLSKGDHPNYCLLYTSMELLVSKAITQNFVPVIDDTETFIGMVKRRTIVEYCYEKMKK